MFKLDYFGKAAFLAQSPQLYKQIMVGSGLERVFEIAPVFRAEPHSTSRHLNEYISLDIEMGFIESFADLLDLEESLMLYIFGKVNESYASEIKEHFDREVHIPERIPRLTLQEALHEIRTRYKHKSESQNDLDPKGESLISRLGVEQYNSEFVFVTHYPRNKRPFYTMPSPSDPTVTESFDLVYNGLEITTGGQRIHDYDQLIGNLNQFNLTAQGLEKYLDAFKYGMPPHGGMGIGLERVTTRLLGIDNVKYGSLFPRDIRRFEP